jgi:hypothetical protein
MKEIYVGKLHIIFDLLFQDLLPNPKHFSKKSFFLVHVAVFKILHEFDNEQMDK